jgi:hypothetical protein
MLKKILCAVTVLAISLGVAMADSTKGKITKVDGTKITIVSKDKETKKETTTVVDVAGAKVSGGEAKATGDLKEGQSVTVEHKDGKATAVTVNVKKKDAK